MCITLCIEVLIIFCHFAVVEFEIIKCVWFFSPFAFAGASLTVQYIMKTSALMFFDDKVLDTGDISANQQKVKDIAVGG